MALQIPRKRGNKMNILLVYPSSRVAGWGSCHPHGNLDGNFMCHGPAAIGTILRKAGHSVTSLDFRECADGHEVERRFLMQKWDVICIGYLSAEHSYAETFIAMVRSHDKDVRIIVGGIHATVSNLLGMDGVQGILHGEADEEILKAITPDRPSPFVIKCPPVKNLDSLPFIDRSLFAPYESTTNFLPLLDPPFSSFVFGRGCPFLCSFCYRSAQDVKYNKHRNRSPESCIEEILREDRRLYGLRSFMVHDDIFPLSKKWVEKFIELYDRRIGNRIRFWCQMRADQIIRFKSLFPDLARIGLTWVSLGAESFAQATLDFIGKGITVEQNIMAIHICRQNKVNLFLNVIKGLPNETKESAMATIEALVRIKPEYHALSQYTDYPGTAMNKYCRDNDLLLEEQYSLTRYPYEPKLKGIDYTGEIHNAWMSVLQYKSNPSNWEDWH